MSTEKLQYIWWKSQWHIKSSYPKVIITVLKAKILVWSLMGSYYTKYFFQIYFWNRYEIIFLLTCNMTPKRQFPFLTPLVSYYKIWPLIMFDKKFQDIWWKNQTKIYSCSRETGVLRFDRLSGSLQTRSRARKNSLAVRSNSNFWNRMSHLRLF